MQKDRGYQKKNSRECCSEKNLYKTDLNIYKSKHFVKDSQSCNILSSNIN